MHEPADADRPGCSDRPGHIESDLVDLTGVSLAAMRGIPSPLRNERLLTLARRPRSNALGGGNPPEFHQGE
ncbi:MULTISPECIES: aldo/keto reductase [unclassified Streptomyces]|uniref:aldo/keto reductase n=1 Tax=unclassified Streptomyces TaxID=2593676 RepID=UPI002251ACDE|nr:MULTISPECIES: aldo/keto reductase [unclassified Streptomyces]MCX4528796.1 aldo/keto reductase [Streptomyces sp. NBC_01551]MCX4540596.1 aldo/keto reductase [Streptomyces sp. NBC_01565]